jgi:hypothetical protein
MNIVGGQAVVTRLQNIADRVPANARKAMHRAAERIAKEAKRRAPVDEHNLEDSIQVETNYDYRGRLEIEITAGGMVDGVDVEDYAAVMHESDYNLGPGSQAKQAANPDIQVGRKFLESAAADEEDRLGQYMIEAVTEAIE